MTIVLGCDCWLRQWPHIVGARERLAQHVVDCCIGCCAGGLLLFTAANRLCPGLCLLGSVCTQGCAIRLCSGICHEIKGAWCGSVPDGHGGAQLRFIMMMKITTFMQVNVLPWLISNDNMEVQPGLW